MIRILTDSAADLTAEERARMNITAVPLGVHFGDDAYLDGETLDKNRFYELLQSSEEFPKTSQPSPADFERHFEDAKEAGDEVVVVVLSSALSGTYQGAKIAKDIVDYEHIHIVDSLSATVGEQLLLRRAVEMRDAGSTAAEIAAELEALKSRIMIYASLDTLEYLCKGGRLSRTAASIGTLANMKPIITVSPAGEVAVVKKCIGKARAMEQIVKLMDAKRPDPNFPLLPVYSYDRGNCDALVQRMTKADYTVSEADFTNIGPTIGTHVGLGAYGVAYIAAE